jgi:hypothetical protein
MKNFNVFLTILFLFGCEAQNPEIRNVDPICGSNLKSACLPEIPDLKLDIQLRRMVPAKIKLKIDGKTLFDQCIADSYDIRRTKIAKDYVRSSFSVYHYDFNQATRDIKLEIVDRGEDCNQIIPILTQESIYLNRRTIGADQVVEGYIYE